MAEVEPRAVMDQIIDQVKNVGRSNLSSTSSDQASNGDNGVPLRVRAVLDALRMRDTHNAAQALTTDKYALQRNGMNSTLYLAQDGRTGS